MINYYYNYLTSSRVLQKNLLYCGLVFQIHSTLYQITAIAPLPSATATVSLPPKSETATIWIEARAFRWDRKTEGLPNNLLYAPFPASVLARTCASTLLRTCLAMYTAHVLPVRDKKLMTFLEQVTSKEGPGEMTGGSYHIRIFQTTDARQLSVRHLVTGNLMPRPPGSKE